jgi:hypothetical protein
MDPIQVARRIFQAGPGQKWKAFRVEARALGDLREDRRMLEAADPWMAVTLCYWEGARRHRRAALAPEVLAGRLRPLAFDVIAQEPPADLELLAIHLRVLNAHVRILRRLPDPGLSDPLIWSGCHLRLGDAWQQIALRGADRQASRAQEHYEQAIRWAPTPSLKGWAANNLACLLHKRADLDCLLHRRAELIGPGDTGLLTRSEDAALLALADVDKWATHAKDWYDAAPAAEVEPANSALPCLTAAGARLAMARVEFGRNNSPVARSHLQKAWDELHDAAARAAGDRPSSGWWFVLWWGALGDAWATEAELARERLVIDQYRSNATLCYEKAIMPWRRGHPAHVAQVAHNLGLLHAVRGEASIETPEGRQTLNQAAEILRSVEEHFFTALGYKEHAAITLHDLGLILERLGDPRGALDAHERAVRIIDDLTRDSTVGPAWAAWFSRYAEVIDRSLSALARSQHPELAVARMAVNFGRDADDLAAIRARPPREVSAPVYKRYLDLEYWTHVYDGIDIGAMGLGIAEDRLKSCRARRRELDKRASKLRRRFEAIDESWRPAASPLSFDELRGLADRAQAPVVGLHVVADGTFVGAALPGGQIRATLLEGLTDDFLNEIILGPEGWMRAYADFKGARAPEEEAGSLPEKDKSPQERLWLEFHSRVDKALEILGRSLWQPLVQWLADGPHGYSPSRRDRTSRGVPEPPPLILIPAGPALDILPLSAMTYADPEGRHPRVAADDYRIVHAPTFRLLGHCLDRRDRRAGASRRRCLWYTIPDPGLSWPEATELYLTNTYPDLHMAEGGSRREICARLPLYEITFIDGHAAYDAAAPLKSCFELARKKKLPLFKVAGMDLSGVQLLGHLGCEATLSDWNNHASGMAGFAGSLLAAGVGSVIGSLWRREHSVVSALLNCRLYKEIARQAGALMPGLALWRAAAWLRMASLKELEAAVADLTQHLDNRERAKAREDLHAAIIDDFGKIPDRAPLRRPRHWAGLVAYGAG